MLRSFKWATIISLFVFQAMSAVASTKVLSYKEWKAAQVEESQSRVKALTSVVSLKKRQIQSDAQIRTEAGYTSDINMSKLDAQLFQERENLELNKKLSMSDYIIMYLTTLPTDKETYLKVAKQMSAEDMAEILLKYNQENTSKISSGVGLDSNTTATKNSNSGVNK